jgi:hypothetical protein
MREDAPQREYSMRHLFDAMRYGVRTWCQWRYYELRVIVRMIEDRASHSGPSHGTKVPVGVGWRVGGYRLGLGH